MKSAGIDYGMGTTNIDADTGIRFGVIHQGEVLQAWCDSAESVYPPDSCGECGEECVEYDDDAHGQYSRESSYVEYACEACERAFDSSEFDMAEPIGHKLDDAEYLASQSFDDCDIFIQRSPYYTRAQFCSPCAPGACYLTSPTMAGAKAYCFGHDWFDGGKAPYPIWRVSDDTPVLPNRD